MWKARDETLGKDVVLKFPLENSAVSIARITMEVNQIIAILKHSDTAPERKHLVRIYGLRSLPPNLVCIEEEYIVGMDFETWRREQTHLCFPWHKIKDLALQVLGTLMYVHRHSICHRDVKPRNLMRMDDISGRSCAKIIDFGIAAPRYDIDVPYSDLSPGAHSIAYASPQQIGGMGATPADDVYGYCATLYHLLTGCTVIEGIPGDPEEVIRYGTVRAPNDRLKDSAVTFRIPPEVEEAIMLGLRKKVTGAGRRPHSLRDIGLLLRTAPEPTVVVDPGRWHRGQREKVRVASSNLMVLECLRESLALGEYFAKRNIAVEYSPRAWNSRILQAIHERQLDAAVFNESCVRQFLADHPEAELEVMCKCARSMNGHCFYLIGSVSGYPEEIDFCHLPKALIDTTIFVNDLAEHVKAVDCFLKHVLGVEDAARVKVERIEPKLAPQVLTTNPMALAYCGQNFRLTVLQRHDFRELVKDTHCPAPLQQELATFTENCFVVNKAFAELHDRCALSDHCKKAMNRFAHRCRTHTERKKIIHGLLSTIPFPGQDDREVCDALERVLMETF